VSAVQPPARWVLLEAVIPVRTTVSTVGTVRVPFECSAQPCAVGTFRSPHAVSPRGTADSECHSLRAIGEARRYPWGPSLGFRLVTAVRICERQTAQVKLHLEEAYKKDLTEHKDLIKELITSIVARMEADPRE
jgi:hypothetical protein